MPFFPYKCSANFATKGPEEDLLLQHSIYMHVETSFN